jgi:hypothetical protein
MLACQSMARRLRTDCSCVDRRCQPDGRVAEIHAPMPRLVDGQNDQILPERSRRADRMNLVRHAPTWRSRAPWSRAPAPNLRAALVCAPICSCVQPQPRNDRSYRSSRGEVVAIAQHSPGIFGALRGKLGSLVYALTEQAGHPSFAIRERIGQVLRQVVLPIRRKPVAVYRLIPASRAVA